MLNYQSERLRSPEILSDMLTDLRCTSGPGLLSLLAGSFRPPAVLLLSVKMQTER